MISIDDEMSEVTSEQIAFLKARCNDEDDLKMNLIEQLGGYEALKSAGLNYRNSGDIVTADKFERACLEYRREHNIFEKSDFITGTWGLEKRVFQIILKPKLKSGVLYLTVNIDGIKKEILAQWMRHATPEEIQAGKRL